MLINKIASAWCLCRIHLPQVWWMKPVPAICFQHKQINHFLFNPRWRCPYQAITRPQASSGHAGNGDCGLIVCTANTRRGPEAHGVLPGQRWTPAKAHWALPSPRATCEHSGMIQGPCPRSPRPLHANYLPRAFSAPVSSDYRKTLAINIVWPLDWNGEHMCKLMWEYYDALEVPSNAWGHQMDVAN